MPIRVTIVGDIELKARFAALYPKARDAVRNAVSRLTIGLQNKVVSEKLSGQVLKNRTGTLRRSIIERVEESATSITGIVGTNLVYAAAHEYGFQGTVNVREHTRRISQAFGRPIAPVEATVRAHSMRMNLPERSYLRSSLREYQPTIEDGLSSAVKEAVESA
jgi:phage gpG-like protein